MLNLTFQRGKEIAQLKPRLKILVNESNEERIIQTGTLNLRKQCYGIKINFF